MDIALTILALLQGAALVHFHYKYKALSDGHTTLLAQNCLIFDEAKRVLAQAVKTQPDERLTLLEQKVAVLQMKR